MGVTLRWCGGGLPSGEEPGVSRLRPEGGGVGQHTWGHAERRAPDDQTTRRPTPNHPPTLLTQGPQSPDSDDDEMARPGNWPPESTAHPPTHPSRINPEAKAGGGVGWSDRLAGQLERSVGGWRGGTVVESVVGSVGCVGRGGETTYRPQPTQPNQPTDHPNHRPCPTKVPRPVRACADGRVETSWPIHCLGPSSRSASQP